MLKQEIIDIIMRGVTKTEGDCWLYKPECSKKQRYYRIKIGDTAQSVHKLAYKLFVDEDLKDLHVLHTCDNPRCVNPSHLWLGTHKENMEDREIKNRGNRPVGAKHYLAKLTEDIVYAMRVERKEKKTTYKNLAERYGVSLSSVDAAINGRRWKSVSMP